MGCYKRGKFVKTGQFDMLEKHEHYEFQPVGLLIASEMFMGYVNKLILTVDVSQASVIILSIFLKLPKMMVNYYLEQQNDLYFF